MTPKPCNHCGSTNLEEIMGGEGNPPDMGWIQCLNCGSRGPNTYDPESAWNARFNEEVMNELMETKIGSLITATLARHESLIKDIQTQMWCSSCKYHKLWSTDHCYMFKELPNINCLCKQRSMK